MQDVDGEKRLFLYKLCAPEGWHHGEDDSQEDDLFDVNAATQVQAESDTDESQDLLDLLEKQTVVKSPKPEPKESEKIKPEKVKTEPKLDRKRKSSGDEPNRHTAKRTKMQRKPYSMQVRDVSKRKVVVSLDPLKPPNNCTRAKIHMGTMVDYWITKNLVSDSDSDDLELEPRYNKFE